MQNQLDLNSLQLVQRLQQAGSFTAAAEQLGCSKTTLSLQLKALEQQLGTALFRRTTRQLSLTSAGEHLLQSCMPLLEQLQQALQSVQSGDKVLQGKLVVSAPEDYTNRKLAPAAVAFRRQHPALEFEFRSSDQVKDAVKENIDLSIRIGWLRDSSQTARKLADFEQWLLAAPAYLQQADMESNGKATCLSGKNAAWPTGPVIFGEPGTNGQHAFYQLMHQGSDIVSADFIAPALSHNPLGDHHEKLLANFLAQPQALMQGRQLEQVVAELTSAGLSDDRIEALARHKCFPGNRPTTTILMEQLTPATLGALIALYEHRIFCQGVIWNINSFDQWGVELGKVLASSILPEIAAAGETREPVTRHDASTNGLIDRINAIRKNAGQ